MPVAMPKPMPKPMPKRVAVEAMKAAAKAVRDSATSGVANWTGHRFEGGPARCGPRHGKSGREGAADGGTSHQGQHYAARAFHDAAPPNRGIAHCTAIRQAKRGDFTASFGSAAAKAECMAERTEEAAGHAG
jgi:hypothetical protein